MTSTEIQMQRQAIAVQRGAGLARSFDPLNEPLRLVMDEPLPDDVYVLAEVPLSSPRSVVSSASTLPS
jgi:hypothetical protein